MDQTFQHTPLEHSADQIRLLQFSPPRHGADELHLVLTAWFVKTAPRYKAISYTWGPLETKRLCVNGRPYLVRSNCYSTLQQVRSKHSADYIWLDSICINQVDNDEKRHQVAIIKDIYDRASLVLVCVGPHEKNSELFTKIATEMEAAVRALDEDFDELDRIVIGSLCRKHWTRCIDSLDKQTVSLLGQALIDFLQRAYWPRLWIVQEVVAARRELLVLCGDSSTSWLGMYLLLELTSVGHAKSVPSMLENDPEYWDYCDAAAVCRPCMTKDLDRKTWMWSSDQAPTSYVAIPGIASTACLDLSSGRKELNPYDRITQNLLSSSLSRRSSISASSQRSRKLW